MEKGGLLARILGLLLYPTMISQEKGADTFIWLASSEDSPSKNADGHYFFKRKRAEVAKFATAEDAERLWQLSEELVAPYC